MRVAAFFVTREVDVARKIEQAARLDRRTYHKRYAAADTTMKALA